MRPLPQGRFAPARVRSSRRRFPRLLLEALEDRLLLATISVNSPADIIADDGVCTLREAVIAANTDTVSGALAGECAAGDDINDTIQIPDSVVPYALIITGAGEDLAATGDLDITAGENVTLTRIAGGSSVVIDATGLFDIGTGFGDRVFHILGATTLDISGVTIQGGDVDGDGGGISNGGTLTLTNTIVRANTAGGYNARGGGIFSSGTVTLTGSTIGGTLAADGNTAAAAGPSGTGRGGGVFGDYGSNLTMTGGTVRNNAATSTSGGAYGGGIFAHDDLSLSGVSVIGNTVSSSSSTAAGGGLAGFFASTIALQDVTVAGNTATTTGNYQTARGGGIEARGTTTIIGGTIGGPLAADGNTAAATVSTSGDYIRATANASGGGIYSSNNLRLESVTVRNNKATATATATSTGTGGSYYARAFANSRGGGILASGTTNVIGGTISNNSARALPTATQTNGGNYSLAGAYGNAYGGGIESSSGTLTLDTVTINDNLASAEPVSTSTSAGNSPDARSNATSNGGGIRVSGTTSIIGGTISNNMATSIPTATQNTGGGSSSAGSYGNASGGGIYNNGTLTLDPVTVSNNTASATPMATSAVYTPLTANARGGGIYTSGTTTVIGGSLSSNSATTTATAAAGRPTMNSSGGALYANSNLNLTNVAVTQNSASAESNGTTGAYANARSGGIEARGTTTISGGTIGGPMAADANNARAMATTSGGYPNASARGGGLFGGYGTVTLTNATLSNNTATAEATKTTDTGSGTAQADSFGGGIAKPGGSLTLNNSTLSDNTASATADGRYRAIANAFGGGIDSSANSTIIGGSLTGNAADATATNTSSGYTRATAAAYGGGFRNNGGTLTTIGSTIMGNSTMADATSDSLGAVCCGPNANSHGGGIWNSGTATVIGGVVNQNTVTSIATRVDANDSSDSSALSSGGGVYNSNVLNLNDVAVEDNILTATATTGGSRVTSGAYGGGVRNRSNATVIGGTISGNTGTAMTTATIPMLFNTQANAGGGGIHSSGSNLTVSDATVGDNMLSATANSNDASATGGGIYTGQAATITNSTVSSNTAGGFNARGGGIINTSTLNLENTDIIGNTAAGSTTAGGYGSGGGLFSNSTATVIGGTVGGLAAGEGNTASGYNASGGGIHNASTLTLNDVDVIGNGVVADTTFGNGYGGGLFSSSTATITGGRVSSNTSGGYNAFGAGIHNTNALTIDQLTVSDNTAAGTFASGGGLFNSGGFPGTPVQVTDSTINGNQATATGIAQGGGIWNSGVVRLINDTVSDNDADDAGGGIFQGAIGSATLTNVTINVNGAASGGGIRNAAGVVTITNTIVASSTAGGDCSGAITSGGNNIASDATCGLAATGDQPSTDPLLGPLQDNGGPTFTHALLIGSPAIDTGDDAADPATDQRGVSRPQDGDCDTIAVSDIGAYEAECADLSVVKSDSPDPVLAGLDLVYTVVVSNAGPTDAAGAIVTDTLPPGVTFAAANVGTTATLPSALSGSQEVPPNASAATGDATLVFNTVTNTFDIDIFVQGITLAQLAASHIHLAPTGVNGPIIFTLGGNTDWVVDGSGIRRTITGAMFAGDASFSAAQKVAALLAGDTYVNVHTTAFPGGEIRGQVTNPGSPECAEAAGVVTCALGAIADGTNERVIIAVHVDPTTRGTITDTASVTANGTDSNLANNSDSEDTTVNAEANLAVTKTDSPDPVIAGQNLTYTVTVTNAGPSTATNVTLTDMLPGGVTFVSSTPGSPTCTQASGTVTCNLGTLAPGGSTIVSITVTVDPATRGTLTNTASVSGTETDPSLANNSDTEITTVNAATDLSVTKSDLPDPVIAGNQLTYTVTVTNGGSSTATNVTLTDPLLVGVTFVSATPTQGSCSFASGTVTCPLGTLAPAGTATVTIVVDVDPDTRGSLTNTATVTGTETDPNPANNSDTETTTVNAEADVAVTKTDSPDPVLTSGNLTYTVTVSNAGTSTATGVTLTDTLPAGVTFGSATPTQGSCSQMSGVVTCNLGSLDPGESATVTIEVVAPASAGPISNTAVVTANESDPVPANNTDIETTTVTVGTDVQVTKGDSPDPVLLGNDVTYTITVMNNGPNTATGVVLTDTLPASVTFVSSTPSSPTCTEAIGTVTCNLGSLASGTNTIVTIVVRPTTTGTITNQVTVTADQTDTNPANNTDTEDTIVNPAANLSVTKSDSPDPVVEGQPLTYTVVVSNAGPSTATGVTVADTLPVGVTFGSATPSQGSCSQMSGVVTCSLGNLAIGANASVSIVVTPTAAGTITNTVTVSANEGDPVAGNNSDSEDTTVNPAADLSVTKSDSPDPVTQGSDVTYTVTVTNNGPSSATGVTLTDTLPAGTTFVSATPSQGACLPPVGDILTCNLLVLPSAGSATVTIVVTADTAGTITNTASATANEADPNPANNSDSESTIVNPASDLSVTKTDSPDPVLLGQNVTYTITVHNNGPSTATGVTLTDTLPASVTFVSATPSQGSCLPPSGGIVTCNLGNLADEANASVTIVLTANTTGTITNSVTVAGSEPDPIPGNNSGSEDTTVNPAADLSVTKTDSPDPVTQGNNVTYTVTVTNNGPSDSTGVTLSDTLPAGVTFVSATPSQGTCSPPAGDILTCNLLTLSSAGSATVTIVVSPNTPGSITNTASVTANEADPNPGNNSDSETTTVTAAADADVSVTKTDSPDPVLQGQNVTYSITIANAGPLTATNVTLTDTLPAGVSFVSATPSQGSCSPPLGGVVTCNIGNVANGANAVVTIVVTANTAGAITNLVSVTASEPDANLANNNDSESTTVNAAADLSVTKSDAPDPVTQGNNVTYTVTVTNNGPSSATGVTLTDTLPAGTTFVSATPSQGTCPAPAGGILTCNLGTVASAGSATVSIVVTANTGGTISNTASASATEADPNPANNSDSASTTVNPAADLSVTKTDLPDPVLRGQNLTYTITVHNDGPATATGVTLTDTLPAGVTFVSATPSQGSCGEAAGVVTCNLGSLADDANASVTIVVTANTSGTITNSVSVAGNEIDPVPGNNSESEDTTVNPAADLSVTKSEAPDPVTQGNDVTYTVTVTNNGPSSATGVTLTDTLPAGTTFVSATPSQGTCPAPAGGILTCNLGTLTSAGSATVSIVVTATTAGTISNTASASATEADPNPANNSDSESTIVNPAADLSVTKTDAPDPVLRGQNVTYTITVHNNGPSTATGVTLSDTLPAGATFVSATPSQGSCPPPLGGIVTCNLGSLADEANASVTIVVTANTTGTITNSVTVTRNEIDPVAGNNSDSEDTTVNPVADLSVTKSDAPDPVTQGSNVTYTVTVTNNGPSSATGVTLTDTLPAGTTFVSATPSQGTCPPPAGGILTCNLGTLTSAGSATVNIVVTATTAGTISNTASASATEADPNPANNSDSESTIVNPAADLSVTKTDAPDPVLRGQNVTYTITVHNNGPSTATGVTLTDTLPAGATFVSATPSQGSCPPPSGGIVTCNLGSLADEANASVTVVLTANTPGTITNSVTVTRIEIDPVAGNNSDSEDTTVNPVADLSVTKSDAPDPVTQGSNVTYTVTVTNNGPSSATGVTLTDTLPTGTTFVSATPSQGTCPPPAGGILTCNLGTLTSAGSATVNIVVTATTAGVITNTASANANEADPVVANNSDSESTTVNPDTGATLADLAVVKTDNPDTVSRKGTLTYTIVVTNNGPADATNVVMTDQLPRVKKVLSVTTNRGACTVEGTLVTCNIGSLANGANATVNIQVRAPKKNGQLINVANVSTAEGDPTLANNSSRQTTTVGKGGPVLSLVDTRDSGSPRRASADPDRGARSPRHLTAIDDLLAAGEFSRSSWLDAILN